MINLTKLDELIKNTEWLLQAATALRRWEEVRLHSTHLDGLKNLRAGLLEDNCEQHDKEVK